VDGFEVAGGMIGDFDDSPAANHVGVIARDVEVCRETRQPLFGSPRKWRKRWRKRWRCRAVDGDERDEEDGISRRPVIAATVRAASNPLGRECKGLSESGSRSAMQTPEFAMHGRK
jgi:hypothetical protein